MFKTNSVRMIDDFGRRFKIRNIEYEIDKWEFNVDGMFGHIHFTVPKGSYEYNANNGAYCSKKDNEYDLIHVATPCFLDEENAIEMSLSQIFKEAIAFADLNLS
ncbi:hypothetical protein JFV29_14155 [Peribacillus sp. TH16]|uniref:hypothetical protein n=1 Tax=Peribacillus sp. TH16 TaxID=2798482 RepID=UPI001914C9E5|nr:hypothetical protein [Peribacillus sp. TH16]MBK5482987.1 hypothetical protein [Peribacillus sp. TH16]MBK5483013.1 hypothetical protein [Peribacillus sp. TH16]